MLLPCLGHLKMIYNFWKMNREGKIFFSDQVNLIICPDFFELQIQAYLNPGCLMMMMASCRVILNPPKEEEEEGNINITSTTDDSRL